MADIRAFRGFRYDLARSGSLADLIAPPYDVVDADLRRRLCDRSPFNAIRVELPDGGPEKYATAGQTLRDWLAADVLRQDTARSLYVCEQRFAIEGQEHVRRGFFARVRLVPLGEGIFPHEQTMSGPKADRLELMRTTHFNLSPIFGLYPGDAMPLLDVTLRGAPPFEAVDHLGVVTRLWTVTDPAAITTVIGALGPQPIYIADGHHRYETALKYREEMKPADAESPANFCLMMLVGMDDPGLIIQPTHRLLGKLPATAGRDLEVKLAEHFEMEPATSARDAWETIVLDGAQSTLAIGTDGRWFVARLRDGKAMLAAAPDRSETWRGLGVSILQKLVIEGAFAKASITYVHSIEEVDRGGWQTACLVPAAEMSHVETIAGSGETMPAKSTYFYPKLPTGLVFHSLKKD